MNKTFQCKACGEKFKKEVLDPKEVQELQRLRRRVSSISCPNCGSANIIEV